MDSQGKTTAIGATNFKGENVTILGPALMGAAFLFGLAATAVLAVVFLRDCKPAEAYA